MPGETLESALEAAQRFARQGLPTTVTHLGENVTTERQAKDVVLHYLSALDRIAEAGLDTEISVKLTHLGFDAGSDLAFDNLAQLIGAARERKRWMWIDMEASPYAEGTVAIYRRALSLSSDVGLCVQAYLRRTAQDVEDLLPLSPSLRLVKGAYREPEDVALRGRQAIDANFLRLSERLLAGRRDGRIRRFAVATHDLGLIERIEVLAAGMGLSSKEQYEVQMLYGIRQADQFRLARAGQPTRCLIAYGPAWYPWYMRRLAERPTNLWFVARNLFSRRPTTLAD